MDVFRFLRPGSVRYLRNTRNTLRNAILPKIRNVSRGGRGDGFDDFGTHEFYSFCEYIGANPWATLPGTLLPEEMDLFMEYHAGPAGTAGGDLRIELGHPKPWTESFRKIHVQFGNEAVTFFGTGFFGPDYWSALIERCKRSPYWQDGKFVFHLNLQGCGLRGMDEHPAFNRVTINGYHIFALYGDQLNNGGDLAGFYDFVFASAWHMWRDPRHNYFWRILEKAKAKKMEISMYEGLNYHTTFGDKKPPVDKINRMITGKAGGVSAVHTGLLLLKYWGARTQQNFNLSQFSFRPGGSFGNIPGRIRLWGGVLNLGDPANRRYRPRFLAHHIVNQVMGGDLIRTVHHGANPTFSVTNRFGSGYGQSRKPEKLTIEGIPRVHSYAFREGKHRGLVLVSMDPRRSHPVELRFAGKVKDRRATMWRLDSSHLDDTNEPDWAPAGPKVTVHKETLTGFRSGTQVLLPPATILALSWDVVE
ncbi:MAG: hypothetical protein D6820_05900 [Lentisphaerae bacterium]|nr:MAG: hypothetical protein D6820_05900 [Lentisphaerota bacterium]